MPGSPFHDWFKNTGFRMLLDQFGETVIYHRRDGGSRPLTAIINREPPGFYGPGGQVVMPEFTIRVLADCTEGVLASEVDTGGDTVELIAELGQATRTEKTVIKMHRQDTGVIELALK